MLTVEAKSIRGQLGKILQLRKGASMIVYNMFSPSTSDHVKYCQDIFYHAKRL